MKIREILENELSSRVLVIAGPMGTSVQRLKLKEEDFRGELFKNHSVDLKGNIDVLVLTAPDIIENIHRDFLNAGADIIETNTFNANRISQSDYRLEDYCYKINFEAAKLLKKVAQEFTLSNSLKPRFVAGVIGPTNKTASLSPDVSNPSLRNITFDELYKAYTEAVEGLIDGGVDILLIETVFDTLNAKAALVAIEDVFEKRNICLPIMISATVVDVSGRTLSGQTIEAFAHTFKNEHILSIGLNCSLGPEKMEQYIKRLSETTHYYVSAHPNAGLPNQFGEYDLSAKKMAKEIRGYLEKSLVNIVGGCCGSTPLHIKYIADIAKDYKPRKLPPKNHELWLTGLEPLHVDRSKNFINIGERTNVAGSRKFAKLINEKKYPEALDIARDQINNGAQIVDICMDDPMIDAKESMVTFLNFIAGEPDIAKVPFMIDSSKWEVIESAIKCIQGRPIINSISLKEGEEIFIERAKIIKKYGCVAVVMAFDEKGQADTFERKIEVCKRSYDILTKKINFPPEDIIFDPNVLAIATGIEEHNNYAVDFINAVKWIKENLPYAKVSGGISNLSFAFRGNDIIRRAMHSVFLYHAIRAGLDMGIVNPALLDNYYNISEDLLRAVEDVVLNRHKNAYEKLIEIANKYKDSKNVIDNDKVEEWRKLSIEDRLQYALIKGLDSFLDEDLNEALQRYDNAINIIEGPLMSAMNKVGELFGNGKMFLPQVVKSARVMKKAVEILQPVIEQQRKLNNNINRRPKILLATVKGDVHDIGKNIVSVVLKCNNYDLVDLGVMVPNEIILEEAIKNKVDIIGLSGLISPSLDVMIDFAEMLEEKKLKLPLLIGGATTSKLHTAVKIDPKYSGPVIHVRDASQSVNVVSSILSENGNDYVKKIKQEYHELRQKFSKRPSSIEYLTIQQARNNKYKYDWENYNIPVPIEIGIRVFKDYSVNEVKKYIDWSMFLSEWGIKGTFSAIMSDVNKSIEAQKLLDDANKLLGDAENDKIFIINGITGIFPSNSLGDDIVIYDLETNKKEISRFFNLRDQQKYSEEKYNLCLSDFIAPVESGKIDYLGLFVTGVFIRNEVSNNKVDDYKNFMIKILANRLAEAFAELIHEKVRKELWGFAKNENLTMDEILKGKYQGIRVSHGYPACPDHSEKKTIFELLNVTEKIDIKLTESYMMIPSSANSGLILSHPEAKYFSVGKISIDQVEDYAKRKSIGIDKVEKLLSQNLNYL